MGVKEYQANPPERDQRFGISAASVEGYDLSKLGASWYINWTYRPFENTALEFVPLIAGYTRKDGVSQGYLDSMAQYIRANKETYPDGTIWLVGNEIGYIPQKDYRSPEQYAQDYHRCYRLLNGIDPSYEVAVGPIILSENEKYVKGKYVEGKGGIHYLQRVLEAYKNKYGQNIPVDYYTATAYVFEKQGVDTQTFKAQIIKFRKFLADQGEADKGLVITEFGCVQKGPGPTEIVDFMYEAFNFLTTASDKNSGCTTDGSRLVQRWAWFTLHDVNLLAKLRALGPGAFRLDFSRTSLFNKSGALSTVGKGYAEYVCSILTKSEAEPEKSRS